MPPERTLTDADISALAAALSTQNVHQCPCTTFTNEEIQFVKTWLEMWKTTRSEVLKWLIKLVLVAIGASFFIWVLMKTLVNQIGIKA